VERFLTHRTGRLALGAGPLVMGIVNVTPDSFSDGGLNLRPEDAIAAGIAMAEAGADILDIGAESSRPGHAVIDAEEEWRRLAPVLDGIVGAQSLPPLSVDTSKAVVARKALAAGASLVNDVWGFQRDPDIAGVAADSGAAAILMHNRDRVDPTVDIVDEIVRFLERSIGIARRAGLSDDRIVVDPGLGFGKNHAQSYQALAALPRLRALGFPVLVGLSRKRFVEPSATRARAPAERRAGTLAANVFAALGGADIIRVHDVAEHIEALRVLSALKAAA
jgi:dihydropteroate synthase